MQAPEYDEVVERLKESENPQLSNENSKKEEVEEIKEEKADILTKENIVLDQNFQNKEEAIAKVQEMMEKSGFVGKGYQDGMLQREKEAPTHFGIGLAIPHGTNQTKKEIKKSGLVVITSKKGVNWDGELVKLIIGIAGKGDDHLQILANVANNVNTEEIVNELVENGNKDQIYEILTREEE
ncbi:phosphoenolpyruvate-dependent sugar phosphotransferase system, EIIA 2 [Anaerococcus hydrogenalis DSM 7454]|uniref:Mannitol-specific phosphotransferase enzyme IIA component n=1 Tax=Anaerococcus hydrogenalis DSM 7454 TaxID=561177 RepID=B6W7M4_9FIRM|nr:PTS sugar transporter subunit IIA [Anaerococcus hydrogenalis]EEB36583.1 phosphoenolpyruvate-dependent sugar phosphotransferase system, EIIA 2 [Anaerococcus hydrogenalis DSM 7454]